MATQEEIAKKILAKIGIKCAKLSKAESGFTNIVYFIDDKYAIKFSNDQNIKEKLKKETAVYQNLILPFIPKYIDSGTYENYRYLIITKISGKSLYSIWHTLSDTERTKIIDGIAQILKTFHQTDGKFLEKYNKTSTKEYVRDSLSKITKQLQELNLNTKQLENIVAKNLDKLFNNVATGLVYNDLHFDNVIYDGRKIYLIDFDRTLISALDYDMMIFKTMCDDPGKFANEKDEVNVNINDYKDIYRAFRNAYPELFSNDYVDSRIAIYQFIYLAKQALDAGDPEWAERELQKLNSHFNEHKINPTTKSAEPIKNQDCRG